MKRGIVMKDLAHTQQGDRQVMCKIVVLLSLQKKGCWLSIKEGMVCSQKGDDLRKAEGT